MQALVASEHLRPFVEIELLGRENSTGADVFWLNFHPSDEDGGGVCRGVWDGHDIRSALEVAKEWQLPCVIHESARQRMN